MMLLVTWQGDLVQRLTQPQDPGTVALTGQPAAILLLAAILALPVSIALLRRYRRAVLRSMRARADQQTAKSVPPETPASPSRPTPLPPRRDRRQTPSIPASYASHGVQPRSTLPQGRAMPWLWLRLPLPQSDFFRSDSSLASGPMLGQSS
jgi:hypothetical protein